VHIQRRLEVVSCYNNLIALHGHWPLLTQYYQRASAVQMRTSSTLNFAHTLWCVIRQDHSIIDVVSPWTQVYSVQHFFLWQWHVALFNYVQCPRNYCDSVTLNQCLINNKIIIIIIIIIIIRTLKRLWAWHQWQKICAYSLQMPLSVKVINIKAHNNILMFCCSWTTVHVSETTYLPVCETRKSAAQNSEKTENIHVSDGLRRIVTFFDYCAL